MLRNLLLTVGTLLQLWAHSTTASKPHELLWHAPLSDEDLKLACGNHLCVLCFFRSGYSAHSSRITADLAAAASIIAESSADVSGVTFATVTPNSSARFFKQVIRRRFGTHSADKAFLCAFLPGALGTPLTISYKGGADMLAKAVLEIWKSTNIVAQELDAQLQSFFQQVLNREEMKQLIGNLRGVLENTEDRQIVPIGQIYIQMMRKHLNGGVQALSTIVQETSAILSAKRCTSQSTCVRIWQQRQIAERLLMRNKDIPAAETVVSNGHWRSSRYVDQTTAAELGLPLLKDLERMQSSEITAMSAKLTELVQQRWQQAQEHAEAVIETMEDVAGLSRSAAEERVREVEMYVTRNIRHKIKGKSLRLHADMLWRYQFVRGYQNVLTHFWREAQHRERRAHLTDPLAVSSMHIPRPEM